MQEKKVNLNKLNSYEWYNKILCSQLILDLRDKVIIQKKKKIYPLFFFFRLIFFFLVKKEKFEESTVYGSTNMGAENFLNEENQKKTVTILRKKILKQISCYSISKLNLFGDEKQIENLIELVKEFIKMDVEINVLNDFFDFRSKFQILCTKNCLEQNFAYTNFPNVILPDFLFLGAIHSSSNQTVLDYLDIDYIVNGKKKKKIKIYKFKKTIKKKYLKLLLVANFGRPPFTEKKKYLVIKVNDIASENIKKWFENSNSFIEECKKEKKKCLVKKK